MKGPIAFATCIAVALSCGPVRAAEGDLPPNAAPFQWVSIGPTLIAPTNIDYDQAASTGRVSSIALLAGGGLLAATANGGVWSRSASGTWSPLTDAQPDLAFGAVAVAPSAALTIYAGSGEDSTLPQQTAVGADGNVWFTESFKNQVGRVRLSDGLVTAYAIPGGNTNGITAGPDGAMWFTETSANRYGRITTTGAVQEFAAPAPFQPDQIVTGPDRELWITGPGGKLGRVSAATSSLGAIALYDDPAGCTSPYRSVCRTAGIVSAADGALWFTMEGGQLGRIVPGGAAQLVTPPTVPGTPPMAESITTDANGALWYGLSTAQFLFRVSFK